jgi:hypothetical protein
LRAVDGDGTLGLKLIPLAGPASTGESNMQKWQFWSHGLAFVLGGVTTFLIFAAIVNVNEQRRYAELKAVHAKALAEHATVLAEANRARAADVESLRVYRELKEEADAWFKAHTDKDGHYR